MKTAEDIASNIADFCAAVHRAMADDPPLFGYRVDVVVPDLASGDEFISGFVYLYESSGGVTGHAFSINAAFSDADVTFAAESFAGAVLIDRELRRAAEREHEEQLRALASEGDDEAGHE
jgi:hypothetical protein